MDIIVELLAVALYMAREKDKERGTTHDTQTDKVMTMIHPYPSLFAETK